MRTLYFDRAAPQLDAIERVLDMLRQEDILTSEWNITSIGQCLCVELADEDAEMVLLAGIDCEGCHYDASLTKPTDESDSEDDVEIVRDDSEGFSDHQGCYLASSGHTSESDYDDHPSTKGVEDQPDMGSTTRYQHLPEQWTPPADQASRPVVQEQEQRIADLERQLAQARSALSGEKQRRRKERGVSFGDSVLEQYDDRNRTLNRKKEDAEKQVRLEREAAKEQERKRTVEILRCKAESQQKQKSLESKIHELESNGATREAELHRLELRAVKAEAEKRRLEEEFRKARMELKAEKHRKEPGIVDKLGAAVADMVGGRASTPKPKIPGTTRETKEMNKLLERELAKARQMQEEAALRSKLAKEKDHKAELKLESASLRSQRAHQKEELVAQKEDSVVLRSKLAQEKMASASARSKKAQELHEELAVKEQSVQQRSELAKEKMASASMRSKKVQDLKAEVDAKGEKIAALEQSVEMRSKRALERMAEADGKIGTTIKFAGTAAVSGQMMKDLRKVLTNGGVVQLAFCIDATGSMSDYMDTAKEIVVMLCQYMLDTTGYKEARIAVVLYRDYGDESTYGGLCERLDFSSPEVVKQWMTGKKADGGGDAPEAVLEGMDETINRLCWDDRQDVTRTIIHILDAPPHGTRYTSTYDRFPDGAPTAPSAEKVFLDMLERQISYVFMPVNRGSDQLSQTQGVFEGLFPDLVAVPMEKGRPGDLGWLKSTAKTISQAVSKSISKTMSTKSTKAKSAKGGRPPSPVVVDHFKDSPWADDTFRVESKLTYYRVNPKLTDEKIRGLVVLPGLDRSAHEVGYLLKLGPCVETHKKDASMKIQPTPFDRGSLRQAFRALCDDQRIVGKELIHIPRNIDASYRLMLRVQYFAQHMAEKYCEALAAAGQSQRVTYVDAFLLASRSRMWACEQYLDADYRKWSSNYGVHCFVDEHPCVHAFSHFTYAYTAGAALVVDLQGVVKGNEYTLTDPSVQTPDPATLPDDTNLGAKGIAIWVNTHKCNAVCRQLKLKALPKKE